MESEYPLNPTSTRDEIPMQEIVYEEDSYGYVNPRGKPVSKELLEQLPSHQLGKDDADSDEVSSIRRRASDYRKTTLQRATLTSHKMSPDAEKIYELLSLDPDATYEQKLSTLRESHQSLKLKRQVKEKLDADMQRRRDEQGLDKFTRLKLWTHSVWHTFLYQSKNMFYSLEPWHSSIKVIQGQFGSGVASYFIFLRWLMYLNIVNCLLLLLFLITPQLLHKTPSPSNSTNNLVESFSGYDLLTGSGWLSDSSLYFGHYTNDVIHVIPGLYYSMPLAYLFVIGVISVINLFVVSYSLTFSYEKNYIDTAGDVKRKFCNKLFSAWDYSIETEEAAVLRKKAFCHEIKELLFFLQRDQKVKTFKDKLIQGCLMILVNICCLGIMVAVSYLIYYLLEKKALKVQVRVLEDMTLALFVTCVSTTSYFVLLFCTKLEFYFTRKVKLYLTMIRAVILRTVMIGIIVYFWTISSTVKEQKSCYESELGHEIYRLILVNFFVFVIFFTLFGEFFRKFFSAYVTSKIKPPQFDVGFNTLDLIYYQTLVWIGTFCMPLAPLMNIVILYLLFYIKRYSVSKTCRPPKRTWSVNEAQTFYLAILFLLFLLSSLTVGYVLFAMDPSSCGPFKGYKNTGDLLHNLFYKKGEEHKTSEIIKYLTSAGVLFTIFCASCVVVYYMRAQAKAQISANEMIREQLKQVQKDKIFLLQLFQDALTMHTQADESPKDTPPREKNPSSGANEDVFINETYDDYYNAPLNSPLPKSFEHGYMPANVPANKQSPSGKIDNVRNPLRATNIGIRSPSSSVGECESPAPKPKGMHIPPHQPGFRHFLHEDSPRINTSVKDLHDKNL